MKDDILHAGYDRGVLEKMFWVWYCCNVAIAETEVKSGTETVDIKESYE